MHLNFTARDLIFLDAFVHALKLIVRRRRLILRFKFAVRHAINALTGRVLRNIDALGFCCFLIPIRKTISTKARISHQVDILHILTLVQML